MFFLRFSSDLFGWTYGFGSSKAGEAEPIEMLDDSESLQFDDLMLGEVKESKSNLHLYWRNYTALKQINYEP